MIDMKSRKSGRRKSAGGLKGRPQSSLHQRAVSSKPNENNYPPLGSRKDDVERALKLMRKVEIPPIRKEHNYCEDSIFREVPKVPLQKLKDIEKSAHISLHERRIREHKLTPLQMELLAKFDRRPRRIAVDLVADIVAEEENAKLLRKIALQKKEAWVAESKPETLLESDDKSEGSEECDKGVDENEVGSVCTSMTFSTAALSHSLEEVFEIDTTNHAANKQNETQFSQRVKRSHSQVVRNRKTRIKEEDERKRAKILSKKTRSAKSNENVVKQQVWLHMIAHFCRLGKLLMHLEKYAVDIEVCRVRYLQKSALRRIVTWYRYFRLRRKMTHNTLFVAKIRVRFAMFVRKHRVQKRKDATSLILSFISAVNESSSRTRKLYKFRSRIIRIQKVFGQYYGCQQARQKLLCMAFDRELHWARLERNHARNIRERLCLRLMKRTHMFGEAVQKLDDACSNLSSMITRRNKANNIKIRQFRQLVNEAGHDDENDEEQQRDRSLLRKNAVDRSGYHFEAIIKKVLINQRRRHVLSLKGEELTQAKFEQHQAVDPQEVKEFLRTPGHAGPTYVVLDHRDIERIHHSPFILLTGGALQEMKSIARRIVAEEDDETVNFEIQKRLLQEL